MTESPGYKASKDRLLKRLSRVEGQVRGITRMIEEDRYCIDVLTQIQASEAALHGVALGLLDDHVRNCMNGTAAERSERADELMGAIGRFVRG
jgi:DNA-binding FrmR family transcriptional regulator